MHHMRELSAKLAAVIAHYIFIKIELDLPYVCKADIPRVALLHNAHL